MAKKDTGNLGDKANTNGFDKNPQNINRNGRKPSIKKQLEEIALADGTMVFKRKDVIEITEEEVKIRVPKQMQMGLKLWSWAMSKKGNDSIRAIQLIMEQFDGKAVQKVDADVNTKVNIPIKKWIEDNNEHSEGTPNV